MIVHDPTIAERYAQALFRTAKKQNAFGEMVEQINELLPLFEPTAKFRLFLEGPQITTEAKEAILDKSLQGRVHDAIHHLLRLMLQKGRMEYARPVMERFNVLVERDQGIYEAEVATAHVLADDQKEKLKAELERFTNARLKVHYVTNPALIGGVRFSYGDVLVDDTIRGKLHRLRQQLETAIRQ